jgi:hypothetical protein
VLSASRRAVGLRQHADNLMRGFEQRAKGGQRKKRCARESNT